MFKTALKVLVMTMPLNSCMRTGQENSYDFCQYAHAIYMSKSDKVTGDTARQILSHDQTGEVLCGWDKV